MRYSKIVYKHPEAPLLKSPLGLVTWGPHQGQSAWRKQSVQPGLNDSTRKAFRRTMLTCKFPMLQRDTVGRPFAKKNQQREQFPNPSGSEMGTCGPSNAGPFSNYGNHPNLCRIHRIQKGGSHHFPIKIARKSSPPRFDTKNGLFGLPGIGTRKASAGAISHVVPLSTDY